MSFGLLLIGGAIWAIYRQRKKAERDLTTSQRSRILLCAWKQSVRGSAPWDRIDDPQVFQELTREFQSWAGSSGWLFAPKSGQGPARLPRDGQMDGPTFAVLEGTVAHSGKIAESLDHSLTRGGHYCISFERGMAEKLSSLWQLEVQVDAGPPPAGCKGPAAWVLESIEGRAIAIAQWSGDQYGSDPRVVVFGPAQSITPLWTEVTRGFDPKKDVEPGAYRWSYDAGEVPKASKDVERFEYLEDPEEKLSWGGPWSADDLGSLSVRRSLVAMRKRVRLQGVVLRGALPGAEGAENLRVWARPKMKEMVHYRGIAITLKENLGSKGDERWGAVYTVPSARKDGTPACALLKGKSRSVVIEDAERSIDDLAREFVDA